MPSATNIIEGRIHSDDIKHPEDLVKNLRIFCSRNNFEMESLEMRNDVYVIRVRRPIDEELNSSQPLMGFGGNLPNSQLTIEGV